MVKHLAVGDIPSHQIYTAIKKEIVEHLAECDIPSHEIYTAIKIRNGIAFSCRCFSCSYTYVV